MINPVAKGQAIKADTMNALIREANTDSGYIPNAGQQLRTLPVDAMQGFTPWDVVLNGSQWLLLPGLVYVDGEPCMLPPYNNLLPPCSAANYYPISYPSSLTPEFWLAGTYASATDFSFTVYLQEPETPIATGSRKALKVKLAEWRNGNCVPLVRSHIFVGTGAAISVQPSDGISIIAGDGITVTNSGNSYEIAANISFIPGDGITIDTAVVNGQIQVEIHGSGAPAGVRDINGTLYTWQQIGTVMADVTLASFEDGAGFTHYLRVGKQTTDGNTYLIYSFA